MGDLPEDVLLFMAEQGSEILLSNYHINHLDLNQFSNKNDRGEGAMMLSALVSSSSLSSITHFRCSNNKPWWSEGNESNVEKLCDAIKEMTNLRYLNLENSLFATEAMCDQVMSAIVANQKKNPSLTDINLDYAGGFEKNSTFTSFSKEHVAALRAKGVTIADSEKEHREMMKLYHPEEKSKK